MSLNKYAVLSSMEEFVHKKYALYRDIDCAVCNDSFEIGDRVVRTRNKVYHKKCFEGLLH